MTACALALAALSMVSGQWSVVSTDRVDVVELNHFYDENGRLVFDQLIFYDWAEAEVTEWQSGKVAKAPRLHVRAWRLVKTPLCHSATLPLCHCVTWLDGDALRKIRAGEFRETWTQHDPELLERSILPKERRRELSRPTLITDH